MPAAFVTMSRHELDRVELMRRIQERRTSQAKAAEALGLTMRQVQRLCRAYREGGAAGLVSNRRGRRSKAGCHTLRDEALRLVCERYADFGPALAHEKLTKIHSLRLSLETLKTEGR